MAVELVPSVLAAQAGVWRQRLRRAERVSRAVHIDLMDGRFVSTRSIAPGTARRYVPTKKVDVHLMVGKPLDWLPVLLHWPTRRVIVHCELGADLRFFLAAARANRWAIDLALNPDTPISRLRPWARYVSGFQVMTVQ